MGLSSWLYTILNYFVISKSSALWTTVTQNAAVMGQVAFLSRPIAGSYQSVPATGDWINNSLLCTLSALYSVRQPNKEQVTSQIADSPIGRYYSAGFAAVPDFN